MGLPQEQSETRFQLWSGQGKRIEIAKDLPEAIALEVLADTDVIVHDMRRWDNPIYEVRLPAIMEDPPRETAAAERFHLEVTLSFDSPITIELP